MTKKFQMTESDYIEECDDEHEHDQNRHISLKQELLNDEISNLVIDIKIDMMDYIKNEAVPLLQHFSNEWWEHVIRGLL